ncbi:right-handed parallel beta-helix repeat-containing protein, partial [Candidatus Bipolaricaulota bacterium]
MSRSFPRGIVVCLVVGAFLASVVSLAVFAQKGDLISGGLRVPEDPKTLTIAFRRVSNGGQITIVKSIRENVVVKNKHDVTVTVEGKRDISISAKDPDESVILFENCTGIIFEGITFEGGSVGFALDASSSVILRGCTVQENVGAGLRGGGVTLEECQVLDNGTWGIELTGTSGARLNVVDSTVSGNGSGGLRMHSGAASIGASAFTGNGGFGIVVDGQASVTFSDAAGVTTISGNAEGGVLVTDATFTLRGNARVEDNLGVGVQAEDSVLNVEDARISGHPDAALWYIRSSGSVSSSTVIDNEGVGILLQEGSDVTVSGTTVTGQGSDGIRVVTGSSIAIADSALSDNALNGLYLEGTRGSVSNSSVTGNDGSGLLLESGAEADVSNTDVASNGVDGATADASTLTITGGTVAGNVRYGVYLFAGSRGTIQQGCVVSDNGVDGVRIESAVGALEGS